MCLDNWFPMIQNILLVLLTKSWVPLKGHFKYLKLFIMSTKTRSSWLNHLVHPISLPLLHMEDCLRSYFLSYWLLRTKYVELAIVLSVQPLSSHPRPTFNLGSSTNISPESLDNPVQTTENFPTTDDQLGLVIYPSNPLFHTVEMSLQCPYSLYDQPGVPLELSPSTCSVIRRHLFLNMEHEVNGPVTSIDIFEVSTSHTNEGEDLKL